jgi:phage replication initiation protein
MAERDRGLNIWEFEQSEKLTQEQLDKNYWRLPLALRQKLKPEPVLSLSDKIAKSAKFAKMNATIYPRHLRSNYAAIAACAGRGPLAEGTRASGKLPPLTNRGVIQGETFEAPKLASIEAKEKLKIVALGNKGRVEYIRIPRPDRQVSEKFAFVDWVNFTWKVGKHPLTLSSGQLAITDRDYVQALSAELFQIFGYGVVRERESGMNFYKCSYDMGDPMQNSGWGLVCIGGQKGSISVTVKGQGLMAAKVGWEQRLYVFLRSIPEAKITRIDLASDNFNSVTSLDDYVSLYDAGLFSNRGHIPNIEQVGNWKKPNGKGRTLYIGARDSGKLLRIYEKGLQLAAKMHDKMPRWLRVELELKNDGRIIPLEALLKPGQYLAGAYPALNGFHKEQERIKSFQKTAVMTIETCLQTTRHQFGRHIWAMVEYYGQEEAIRLMTVDKEQLPKRLEAVSAFQANIDESEFMHKQPLMMFQMENEQKPPLHDAWMGAIYQSVDQQNHF